MTEPVMMGMDLARPGSDKTVVLRARQCGKGLSLEIVREAMKCLEPYRAAHYDNILAATSEPVPTMPEETGEWIPNNRKGRRHQAAIQRRKL